MKKITNPVLRRELTNIFYKLKMTDSEIATACGVFYTTVGRWRRLEIPPEKENFERLQQLANGQLLVAPRTDKPPGFSQDWLEGKFAQLTNQVALLQGQIAILGERVAALEGEKKTRSYR